MITIKSCGGKKLKTEMELVSETPADFVLGLIGKAFFISGSAISYTGAVYFIQKISDASIFVIENLHHLINSKEVKRGDKPEDQVLITRQGLQDGSLTICKIFGAICIGLFSKFVGGRLSHQDTIKIFNDFLYGK